MLPDASHVMEVQIKLFFRLEDLKSLGEGLHHAVLDAVVDHLHVVAGTGRADAPETLGRGRRQRLKDGLQPRIGIGVASHHQAVSLR